MSNLSIDEIEEMYEDIQLIHSTIIILECASAGKIILDNEYLYPVTSHLSSVTAKLKKIIEQIYNN